MRHSQCPSSDSIDHLRNRRLQSLHTKLKETQSFSVCLWIQCNDWWWRFNWKRDQIKMFRICTGFTIVKILQQMNHQWYRRGKWSHTYIGHLHCNESWFDLRCSRIWSTLEIVFCFRGTTANNSELISRLTKGVIYELGRGAEMNSNRQHQMLDKMLAYAFTVTRELEHQFIVNFVTSKAIKMALFCWKS